MTNEDPKKSMSDATQEIVNELALTLELVELGLIFLPNGELNRDAKKALEDLMDLLSDVRNAINDYLNREDSLS